ncbi:MAG TPA: DedA family protein [Rhizomicrobium sp.]|jgi:membrane protein DedA with SNARE-associated domain|nr:DedA family protein [Rhizomicrobium sp.]
MSDLIQSVVAFIGAHSEWTFPIIFITSFGESFVFVSFLFPGTTIMIAAGFLVPDGTVPFMPLVAGAILGAVVGDAISWWLGRRYGRVITNTWPLSRNPELIERGRKFFLRFGAASVFVGRFFGPMRAVIPLVAGITRLPGLQFWTANIASALIWAPAMLVPGILGVKAAELSGGDKLIKILIGASAVVVVAVLAYAARRYKWFERRIENE